LKHISNHFISHPASHPTSHPTSQPTFHPTAHQSWKKLHAAHTVRADIFLRIEDILVQKSRKYVAIADLCGDFIYFEVNIEG
jgi:hypothetical protein